MQTRPQRAERPAIDLRRLVAGFLRMAPDVAIVGMVRDREALPREGYPRSCHAEWARRLWSVTRRADCTRPSFQHPHGQHGQVIDIYVSQRHNTEAARRFFDRARADHTRPVEVVTDKAQALLAAVDDVLPDALPNTDRYANNRVEADHGRLKARLRPMRSLKSDRTAGVVIRGHAFAQNVRRGHYELGIDARRPELRLAAAFDELADMI